MYIKFYCTLSSEGNEIMLGLRRKSGEGHQHFNNSENRVKKRNFRDSFW